MTLPALSRHRRKNFALRSGSDYFIEALSVLVITLFALFCLSPFFYVFFVSFMPYEEYIAHPLRIIPRQFTLTAYAKVWDYALIRSAYRVSVSVTVLGTALSVFLLVISAYPLSKKKLGGRRVIMGMILFTMYFNGGMIPNYILLKAIGLHDTLGVMFIPWAIGAFNLILMKNFIQQTVPESLEEAARVDGANDLYVLFRVVVPLIKPAIATMTVFCAVTFWNNYYLAMMYVSSRKLWPLTLVLRELVVESTSDVLTVSEMLTAENRAHPFTLRMAAIVITIMPILIVYPFMQRYFIKGLSLGSVKE